MTIGSEVRWGDLLPRKAAALVTEAIADTRVVLVNGARQSGKSTLVRRIGSGGGARWYSLDNAETRRAVADDLTGFARADGMTIVDEVQRLPELLLSIKEVVDEDPRPGRFLLTGSARVLGLRDLPDTLVGRMETVELWPFSQGEIDGAPDGFVDAAFEVGAGLRHESEQTRDDYVERIVRGGFPESVTRREKRRQRFLDSYVADLVNRDVMQLSEIERGKEMHTLVDLLAARSGQEIVPAALANSLGVAQPTVNRHLRLLEEVFLIKRIPAWSRNLSTRAVSRSKVAFVDSGVAANVLGHSSARLKKFGSPIGGLLEGFVAMEIARQLTWADTRARLHHYRTRDQIEVDLVLENRLGEVVGIEVKASSTPSSDDFRGLRHLQSRLGEDFLAGFVLYTGQRTLSFGPRLKALPISALWDAQAP